MFWVGVGILLFVIWRIARPYWRRRPTENEAILVTGCDSGFGFHIAKALVEATDAAVFAGYVTQEGATQLKALGPRVHAIALNVTSDSEVDAAFEAIEKSGKVLMGVVNNAGIGSYGFAEGISMDCYEKIISINLVGVIRVTKRALPFLRRSKGRLVTMGSLGCRMPSAFGSAYIPTKAAVACYQDCVRQETWKFGMRCSLVEPGFFATGMLHRSAVIGESAMKDADDSLKAAYGSYADKMKRSEGSVKLVEKLNGGEVLSVSRLLSSMHS